MVFVTYHKTIEMSECDCCHVKKKIRTLIEHKTNIIRAPVEYKEIGNGKTSKTSIRVMMGNDWGDFNVAEEIRQTLSEVIDHCIRETGLRPGEKHRNNGGGGYVNSQNDHEWEIDSLTPNICLFSFRTKEVEDPPSDEPTSGCDLD